MDTANGRRNREPDFLICAAVNGEFWTERYRERTSGMAAPNITLPLPEFLQGDFSRLLGAGIVQAAFTFEPLHGCLHLRLIFIATR